MIVPASSKNADQLSASPPHGLLRIHETHLVTAQATETFDEFASLIRSGQRVFVLCYERDPAHLSPPPRGGRHA